MRADQRRRAREQLEDVLMEALRSGEPMEVGAAQWEALRQKIQARATVKGRSSGTR